MLVFSFISTLLVFTSIHSVFFTQLLNYKCTLPIPQQIVGGRFYKYITQMIYLKFRVESKRQDALLRKYWHTIYYLKTVTATLIKNFKQNLYYEYKIQFEIRKLKVT